MSDSRLFQAAQGLPWWSCRHAVAGQRRYPPAQLRRCYQPTAKALAPISRAMDLGEISLRAAGQVIAVAWTLADLAGEARPGARECGLALAFQLGVAR